jgi:hypothetical protein
VHNAAQALQAVQEQGAPVDGWFDDEAADRYEADEYGEQNCLLDLINHRGRP